SQAFLDKIIALATYAGVKYNKEKFYFDQVNDIIKSELKRNG
ncbi:LytR family transcriptional regulator, partial [Enterococcus faecium]